jgi:hypothetical protein
VVISIDHPAETGDATIKFHKCLRKFRVEKVEYINPTGLATDNTNSFEVALKNGTTKVAAWNTDGDATGINGGATEGSITANTFLTLTKSSTDANLVFAAGDVMSLSMDETGDTTLPAGRMVVHGRYL